jgi:hypothetical protein
MEPRRYRHHSAGDDLERRPLDHEDPAVFDARPRRREAVERRSDLGPLAVEPREVVVVA